MFATKSARKLVAEQALQPGDVLVVSSQALVMRLISWWPFYWNKWNHIAIYIKTDEAGTQWALEARPGGVGWRKVSELGRVLTNVDQPKTEKQRADLSTLAVAMLKTPYDWEAIEREAFAKLHDHGIRWDMEWDGDRPPVQIICSAYAAYLYWNAHLSGPHSWLSTPADWARFITARGWEAPGATHAAEAEHV